ncbi:DNA-binding response OmpR family regulator [Sphingobium sp. B7D2B]|uniref:response regulator transcription factor n=1 Tax=Sphingobium sp. B7D2B TaxID=2940583 RepID=UPI00222477B7|nr:response regulator transcription factor [Sphingobium sp. B7D2B]MCW2367153.1 DNA-binding response OmpR family regulator [Sphingobium sp. B7D2B]
MPDSVLVSIVEDDDDLRSILSRFLSGVGMKVAPFANTADLDDVWRADPPDVVILDVNLPGENGIMAAARLRSWSQVGIIILTGRTAEEDKLLSLSMGVDHYLHKPVNLRELESVIRNLARRVSKSRTSQEDPVGEKGSWHLDLRAWLLTAPNGKSVKLSSLECQILAPLLETPGQAVSRDVLNANLGKTHVDPDNRALDVLISRMRRRVEDFTGMAFPVRAARGTGYVVTATDQPRA